MQGGDELKEAYKNMKRHAKSEVAKVKNEAYKEWYDKMGTEQVTGLSTKWQNKGQDQEETLGK